MYVKRKLMLLEGIFIIHGVLRLVNIPCGGNIILYIKSLQELESIMIMYATFIKHIPSHWRILKPKAVSIV